MKSPQDMRIIQIDITNACVFQCSNCTRFCGHHKKPFFMEFETFKRAVDSLDGYVGTIGMMGGEPTLNPEFERMAEYLASKKPLKKTDIMLRPQRHFMDGIHDLEFDHTFLHPCGKGMRQTVDGPGLWATTRANYKKYYETIQDCIQYQALNDHSNAMYHQPGLISRKSLDIADEDWIKLRDNCWIQNEWSASITPKGAFFCEVAAALDMLFDGPGGWPIEYGWWKNKPSEFGEQLQWCEYCGLALRTFTRNANDQVYDVSPDLHDKLKAVGSPLVGTKHENIVEIKNGIISERSKTSGQRFSKAMPYTESYSARYNEERTSLIKKNITGIIICNDLVDVDHAVYNYKLFKDAYIYCSGNIKEKIFRIYKEKEISKDDVIEANSITLGHLLYDVVDRGSAEEYLLVVENGIRLKGFVLEDLNRLVLNPGTLLYSISDQGTLNNYYSALGNGSIALFSLWAKSVRKNGWDRFLKMNTLKEILELWQKEKVYPFVPDTVYTAPAAEIDSHKRYIVYGTGFSSQFAIQKIYDNNSEVVAVVDSNPEKWGNTSGLNGLKIMDPEEVLRNQDGFDKVMIGSSIYYREIKNILLDYGIPTEKMAWI